MDFFFVINTHPGTLVLILPDYILKIWLVKKFEPIFEINLDWGKQFGLYVGGRSPRNSESLHSAAWGRIRTRRTSSPSAAGESSCAASARRSGRTSFRTGRR